MSTRLRRLLPAAVLALALAIGHARADDPVLDPAETEGNAATVTCDSYEQVSCTGTNPAVVSDILQLAVDSRESLAPLLKLGKEWRFPVHITVLERDPRPGAPTPREGTAVITDGKTLRIEASLPANDLDAREFVQRQFVTAMVWEKYFAPGTTFSESTRLDMVPLWLLEGLREWLNDDPERNRAEIVKRAVLAGRAPLLSDIIGWKNLDEDRLLGLWQRAFCYYLLDSLIDQPGRRADFQQWLASITGATRRSPAWLFPTEAAWQRELLQSVDRSRSLVFTWDESAAELTAAETIALPKEKGATDTRLCTIETVGTFRSTPKIDQAIQKKILDLTALQLRVHPGWQPIIQLYRFGLTALARDHDRKRAADYLHEAHVRREAEVAFHAKLVDYTNWFEVTQNMPAEASHFRSYFQVAQETDRMEADPRHPNPLRGDLLKVESRF